MYNDNIISFVLDHAPFTWEQFYAFPFKVYDGAKSFWEPGYDYSDPDFWSNYPNEVQDDIESIHAVQMYDWLMKNCPEE